MWRQRRDAPAATAAAEGLLESVVPGGHTSIDHSSLECAQIAHGVGTREFAPRCFPLGAWSTASFQLVLLGMLAKTGDKAAHKARRVQARPTSQALGSASWPRQVSVPHCALWQKSAVERYGCRAAETRRNQFMCSKLQCSIRRKYHCSWDASGTRWAASSARTCCTGMRQQGTASAAPQALHQGIPRGIQPEERE